MADEAIVVGADDQASKVLGAVEKQIQSLSAGVANMATQTTESTQTIVSRFELLTIATVSVGAAWGAAKLASELYASSRAAVDLFQAQEASIDGLRHSLSRYVDDVDAAVAKQREFASSLQAFSGIGDESTLALQRQAAQLGYSETQITALIATAAGLKGEYGLAYEEAFRLAIAATERNSDALAHLIPEMRLAYTEAQKFELVQQAAARGMSALAAETDTVRGEMARAQGYWGDLYEVLGSLIAPVFETIAIAGGEFALTLGSELAPAVEFVNEAFAAGAPLVEALTLALHNAAVIGGVAIEAVLDIMATFGEYLGINAQAAESWGDTLSSVVQWASENIIAALTWVEVILTNLPQVFELSTTAAEFAMVFMVEEIKYALTVRLPALFEYLTGYSASWAEAFLQGIMAFAQGLYEGLIWPWEQLGKVIPIALGGALGALSIYNEAVGATFTLASDQIAKLPEVAERQLTEREKALQATMGQIGGDLASQFQTKFDERVARLGVTARENMVQSFEEDTKRLQQRLPRIGVDTTQLNAVEARFLTRGQTDDPLFGIEANTLRTARSLEDLPADLAAALERQAERRADGTVIKVYRE